MNLNASLFFCRHWMRCGGCRDAFWTLIQAEGNAFIPFSRLIVNVDDIELLIFLVGQHNGWLTEWRPLRSLLPIHSRLLLYLSCYVTNDSINYSFQRFFWPSATILLQLIYLPPKMSNLYKIHINFRLQIHFLFRIFCAKTMQIPRSKKRRTKTIRWALFWWCRNPLRFFSVWHIRDRWLFLSYPKLESQ